MSTALITGASAGIGAAFARTLAADGLDLVLVARRKERLDDLAQKLTTTHGIRCEVFPADLGDPAAPRAITAFAAERGLDVDVLINNAGLSGNDTFADTSCLTTDIATPGRVVRVDIVELDLIINFSGIRP